MEKFNKNESKKQTRIALCRSYFHLELKKDGKSAGFGWEPL